MTPAEKRRARRLDIHTRPNCPSCGEALRRERVRGDDGRQTVRFLACRCGHQEGHAVEREGAA